MRTISNQIAVAVMAILLVTAVVSPSGQRAIEDTTGVEPVGNAEAAIVSGTVLAAAGAGVVVGAVGCAVFCGGGSNTEKVESTDAEQAKIDIYSSGSAAHDEAEVALTSINNHLEDSKEIALMVGKNAAIEAYMNGSSEIQAEQAAKNAIEDYYTRKELTLIKSWNVTSTHANYLDETSENESGIGTFYVEGDSYNVGGGQISTLPTDFEGFGGNRTVGLSNGSSHKIITLYVNAYSDGSPYESGTVSFLDETYFSGSNNEGDYTRNVAGVNINAQDISGANYSQFQYIDFSEYQSAWNKIDTMQSDTKSEIQVFVNTTYPEWEAGAINESQLIDPYLGSRYYSPNGDFENWALRTYSAMGLGSPKNLSSFGSMTVTSGGESATGILMSKGIPEGGTFETGKTYNATELAGMQYVIGSSKGEMWEVTGEFTIESMTDSDGETVQNVTYRNVTYESANLSEYQELAEELQQLRQEIEQDQQEALGGGGSSPAGDLIDWLFGSTYGIPNALIAFAGVALVTILNNRRK